MAHIYEVLQTITVVLERFGPSLYAEVVTLFVLLNTLLAGVMKEIKEHELENYEPKRKRRRRNEEQDDIPSQKTPTGNIGVRKAMKLEIENVTRGVTDLDSIDYGEGNENMEILVVILNVLSTLLEDRVSILQPSR